MENSLRWFGHVERRVVDSVAWRVARMGDSYITKGRGRPRTIIRETIRKI